MSAAVRASLVSFAFSCLLPHTVCHSQAPAPAPAARLSAETLLTQGIAYEKSREWVDAIQHYEKAIRSFPDDAELRRRLLISRLHFDVVRRSNDSSIQAMLSELDQHQAMELYSEVLARLELSYVDPIEMSEIVRGGTAYLEVALTEPSFLSAHVQGRSRADVEKFRTSIHRLTLSKPVENRFEAADIVRRAAAAGHEALGIEPATTMVQFVLGAIGLLDPYSSFLSSAELNEVESQIEGNFVGLGIALEPHEAPLRILNVIPGGPAKEAGLQAGDLILEIGSMRCVDVGAERAADLLRGPEKSQVRLLIQKQDGSHDALVVVRRRVEVPSVEDARMVDPRNGVAYFKINSFQKTTAREVDQAMWDLHRQGMTSLIIDLRGNPGGWLDASIAVADRFLSAGRIVSTRGKNGIENQNYSASRGNTWSLPLTLLIDEQSASASEILAGAIRDNGRGELVGQTSYGKGSVQGLFHTKSLASGIRLTVSKFYSPSGQAISERGVDPTLAVDGPDDVHFVAKPVASSVTESRVDERTDRVLEVAIQNAVQARTALRPASARAGQP